MTNIAPEWPQCKPSLEHLLPDLQPGRKERHGPCWRCGGDNRFIIFLDTGRAWCRRCHWTGDALQLLRDRDGLTFSEAKRQLGLDTDRAPAAKRQATNHLRALAEAKRLYAEWQRKTLNDLIDPYQEICTKCYIAEVACRAIDRAPQEYPDDERHVWIHRRAAMRERLAMVNHALSILLFTAHEPERFAWWQRAKGVARG